MQEQANKRPRICQMLGVEIGEEWSYPGFAGPFRVNQDGYREYKSKDGVWYLCQAEEDLTEIINHPDRIIRQPRFTEEEVADAKVLMRALGATGLKRNRYEDIYATSDTSADTLLDSEMFPSLRPGQTVSLEEIVT